MPITRTRYPRRRRRSEVTEQALALLERHVATAPDPRVECPTFNRSWRRGRVNNRRLQVGLGILVSVVAAAWFARGIEWKDLGAVLARVHLPWVLLSALVLYLAAAATFGRQPGERSPGQTVREP